MCRYCLRTRSTRRFCRVRLANGLPLVWRYVLVGLLLISVVSKPINFKPCWFDWPDCRSRLRRWTRARRVRRKCCSSTWLTWRALCPRSSSSTWRSSGTPAWPSPPTCTPRTRFASWPSSSLWASARGSSPPPSASRASSFNNSVRNEQMDSYGFSASSLHQCPLPGLWYLLTISLSLLSSRSARSRRRDWGRPGGMVRRGRRQVLGARVRLGSATDGHRAQAEPLETLSTHEWFFRHG